MKQPGSFLDYIDNTIKEMNTDIEKLYSTTCKNKWNVLCHLKSKVSSLEKHMERTRQSLKTVQVQTTNEMRTFTPEELSQYNGRGGTPAYVAVNGVVYDVTDDASWVAARHYGLGAGVDLTFEYVACHTGSDILPKLRVVGTMTV